MGWGTRLQWARESGSVVVEVQGISAQGFDLSSETEVDRKDDGFGA
jgi:hypothetical protein